jgi:mono/diheme cytochrome c family protein
MAWTTMALLFTAVGGCGGGSSEGGAEVAGTSYEGPIASNDVARGEEVFNSVCQSCHGSGAPQLAGLGWEVPAMRHQIREGSGRMPALRATRLTDPDMEAVLAYLATNGGVNGGAETGPQPETEPEPETGGGEEPVEGDTAVDE